MLHRLALAAVLAAPAAAQALPDAAALDRMSARLAPTTLTADLSGLSAGDRRALDGMIAASRVLDRVFLRQLWAGNPDLLERLKQDGTPLGKARLRYFLLNKAPWSELDGRAAFLPGVPAKMPPGAGFYPEDMTKAEFESWTKTLTPEAKAAAEGYYTVIRRGPDGRLKSVPYGVEYKAELEEAARLLRAAAADADAPSLKRFLDARADALLSDDYYASEIAWMELDSPLDLTYGPYETYNDELFGYKAAFEAYVTVRDAAETAKLAFLGAHLQEIEDHLPEDPADRTPKLGGLAPIVVVDEVFSAGDGNHGVHTAAYNLPNDDKVVQLKGSKRVMLKNVQEAKFKATLEPIARRVLSPAARRDLSFELFFTHIVMHELSHGLGPHVTKAGGRETNPRLELKDLYGAVEEAKADVVGLFALQRLMDRAGAPGASSPLPHGPDAERRLYTTYLASCFRTLRFGVSDAHAKGMAVQMSWFLEKKAVSASSDGTFSVDPARMKAAVESLARALLTLEAKSDYAGASKLLAERSRLAPAVSRALERLKDLPTDIAPVYPLAGGR